MRRTGVLRVAFMAMTIAVSGCSKTEVGKPPAAEKSEARPGAVGTGGAGANIRSDDDFVRDVAIKNMAEVELSRTALNRTTNPDIRSFAQGIVDDHGAAGNNLKAAVSGQPIEWPAQLDDKHRKIADELARKQGADFDRHYLEDMIDGHLDLTAKLESRLDVQSLADWKTAAAARTRTSALPEPGTAMRDVQVRPDKSGNDVTMKINQWAAETYPMAQKHLDAARTLENAAKKRSTD